MTDMMVIDLQSGASHQLGRGRSVVAMELTEHSIRSKNMVLGSGVLIVTTGIMLPVPFKQKIGQSILELEGVQCPR